MSKMKALLDEIINCEICEGKGITNFWSSPDGDYDFEWCDCNPHALVLDEDGEVLNGNLF